MACCIMFAHVWLRDWDQFTNHDGSASATALPPHLQLPHFPHALSIIAIIPQHLPPWLTILPPSHSPIMFFISFLLMLHSHIFPIMKLVFRFPTSTVLYTVQILSSLLNACYSQSLQLPSFNYILLWITFTLWTYIAVYKAQAIYIPCSHLMTPAPTAIFLHRRENNFPCSHLTTPISFPRRSTLSRYSFARASCPGDQWLQASQARPGPRWCVSVCQPLHSVQMCWLQ